MIRIACAVTALLLLAGCVSMKPVNATADAVSALHGAPLTVVTYTQPDFVASTWGRAGLIGGLAGAAVMISEGDQLVKDDNIPDPAIATSAALAPEFAAKFGSTAGAPLTLNKRDDDSPADMAALAGHKGVVFDLMSVGWQFIYFPFDWTHYRVMYSARGRLIDASNGTVIGQVPCNWKSDDHVSGPPPNYDQLTGDNGKVLKDLLAQAGQDCTAMIREQMFR